MSSSQVAKRYFDLLAAHDVDGAAAMWSPTGVDRFVGQRELEGPDGVRAYFESLFAAFPDFAIEVLEVTAARSRAAVRWRARGTFAGPGTFEGFEPNGAVVALEGCDVITVYEDMIVHNDAYMDSGDIARQLGVLPRAGSRTEERLTALANLRGRARRRVQGGEAEPVAQGVWLVRGGFPVRSMNVYLIEEDGGVLAFDAGIRAMTGAVATAAARLGGLRRVVLGHADADHRGSAPGLGVPVYCHPRDREAAEDSFPFRSYWDFEKLDPHARVLYPRLLRSWDGGAVTIAGTVSEGDEVAGFRVVELPGHAPGLIGLYREFDGLALVSDCIYTLDPQTGRKGPPRVPHAAFDEDIEQARASIRKLADLAPAVVWAGHADPVTGDVAAQLARAAAG